MCVLLVSNLKTSKAEIDIFGREKLFTLRLIKKKLLIDNIDFNFCEAKFFLKLYFFLDHTTLLWMIIIHTYLRFPLAVAKWRGLRPSKSCQFSVEWSISCTMHFSMSTSMSFENKKREGVLCTYYLLYKEATFSK